MSPTINTGRNDLLTLCRRQFLIILLMLFSLVFVSAAFFYADPVYVALLRKFYAPKIERDFGFTRGTEVFRYDDKEYEYFSIQSVEPNGILDKAGFKPRYVPIDWGCKFFEISKTNEAAFYSTLMNAQPGEEITISIIDFNEFSKSTKPRDNPFYYESKIALKIPVRQY